MVSLKFELNAAFLKHSLTSSTPTPLLTVKLIIARLTFGVGTLMAFAVIFPFSSGRILATALAAPVSVITRFKAALLPLRSDGWKLSIKF